jgi:glucose/arabinose dehydrogenase
MPGRALAPITLALLAGCFVCLRFASPATTLPNNFEDNLVTDVSAPIALTFLPDGRLLVASKMGQLWVYENGQKTQALDLSSQICSSSERGLLGVAVDRTFGTTDNNYVYLYYTYKKHGVCPDHMPGSQNNPVNRVSRFVMTGNTVDKNTEIVLIDNIPSPNGNHNAGDLHFGNDGNLYVSIGDGGCDYAAPKQCQYDNNASRDRHVLLGKILRIEPDGGIPPDNPYTHPASSAPCADEDDGRIERGKNCQETFAWGLRNPFRFAMGPDTSAPITRFFVNDVGGSRFEEIDEGKAGADYGWNLCEGRRDNTHRGRRVKCSGGARTLPIHTYSHNTGCRSITGGAFVPDDGLWPDDYEHAYLFGDFICHKIFMLKPIDGGGFVQTAFATNLGGGGPIAMVFDPYDPNTSLYYTTFANGGEVRRISYTGG